MTVGWAAQPAPRRDTNSDDRVVVEEGFDRSLIERAGIE